MFVLSTYTWSTSSLPQVREMMADSDVRQFKATGFSYWSQFRLRAIYLCTDLRTNVVQASPLQGLVHWLPFKCTNGVLE